MKPDSINHKIAKLNGKPAELYAFQSKHHPVELYTDLITAGMNKRYAKHLAKMYEEGVYHLATIEFKDIYKKLKL